VNAFAVLPFAVVFLIVDVLCAPGIDPRLGSASIT